MPWWAWALAWLAVSGALALLVAGAVRLREQRDPRPGPRRDAPDDDPDDDSA